TRHCSGCGRDHQLRMLEVINGAEDSHATLRARKQAPDRNSKSWGRALRCTAIRSRETRYEVRSKTWRTVAAYHRTPPCAVGTRLRLAKPTHLASTLPVSKS